MSYNTDLQSNNADLQEILDTVNALPEAGEGSGGSGITTVTVVATQMESSLAFLNADGTEGTIGSYTTNEVLGGVLIDSSSMFDLECDKEFFTMSVSGANIYLLPQGGTISLW